MAIFIIKIIYLQDQSINNNKKTGTAASQSCCFSRNIASVTLKNSFCVLSKNISQDQSTDMSRCTELRHARRRTSFEHTIHWTIFGRWNPAPRLNFSPVHRHYDKLDTLSYSWPVWFNEAYLYPPKKKGFEKNLTAASKWICFQIK